MKKIWFVLPIVLLVMACGGNSGSDASGASGVFATKVDSMSYAVGTDLITQFKNGLGGAYQFTFNEGAFIKGIEESYAGSDQFSQEAHQALGMQVQLLANGVVMARQNDPTYSAEMPVKKEYSMENINDSISYSLGAEACRNLTKVFVDGHADKFDLEKFKKGTVDAFSGTESLPEDAVKEMMSDFNVVYGEAAQEMYRKEGEKNKAEGEAFLAENATKDGIQTTDSGLQYKVVKKGKGKKPADTDKVKVHYEGKLLNGDIFDSSIKRGEPISFALNGVIRGWTEGLQLMNVGSKYTFYISGDLAYGMQPPQGSNIPPNSTLVFDVELLGIE